jgi:adenylate cyclase, class 2
MTEVELKFEIAPGSWPQIEEQCATLQLVCRLRNSDTYYDTAGFDLLSQAVFVRVRNHLHLEFKFNEQAAPAHIQCTERVFSLIPDPRPAEEMNTLFSRFVPRWRSANTVKEALRQNGMIKIAYIENQRVQYTYEDFVVSVDHVEGLGDFVEIEAQCEEGSDTSQVEALEAQMQRFAAGFAARQVRVGYVELWLQKHHPQAYQRGKYHQ